MQGDADLLAAKAALETASLNMGYTKVTAPISGRIGKAQVTEGALVSGTELTQLALIRQMDPVYVDFTQSSADVLALRRSLAAGMVQNSEAGLGNVSLVLEDGSTYECQGRIKFSDISVSESTGSLTVRAEFPNTNKLLMPGMFVRGRVEESVKQQAILLSPRGVSRGQGGQATVLVVNPQNQVESRAVETGSMYGNAWIITRGLNSGERVIVEGTQKAPVGATVVAVPFQETTNAPTAQH
jgi:RND family efflux transporter MFP subunit